MSREKNDANYSTVASANNQSGGGAGGSGGNGSNFLSVPTDPGMKRNDSEFSMGIEEPGKKEGEEEEERAQWDNSLQFFFTVLGFCVGLGNIWRFPYLCQEYGGGAFVIPFLVMMVLEGMPLLLLELGIGQKMRKGSFVVWNQIHPWLGGIGLGSTVIAIVVGCYYNMIIAWCQFYLLHSFAFSLSWSSCPTLESETGVAATTSGPALAVNGTVTDMLSEPSYVPECAMSSETQYFWYREALDISPSISDFGGGIRWWMFLSLAFSWLLVYLIVMRGIQSSGYIVYFTACFPYIVLTIFFVRGMTLKGAGAGLVHMFYPKLDQLMNPTVWLEAATQVFFSYGLAFGSLIGFGSYNPPNKNCIRDVFIITACNAFTAVYACAVIFAILGFKAQHLFDKCMDHDVATLVTEVPTLQHLNASDVSEQQYRSIMTSGLLNSSWTSSLGLRNCSLEDELNDAAQGTGLAFIVMADVFTKLPWAPFWSFLFFSMLLSLGVGSQIGILEGVMGTLFDMPQLRNTKKEVLSGIACLTSFSAGIIFTTGSGEYWLGLFNKYGAMGLTLIAFIEIMSVMYVYGHEQFTEDLFEMTNVRPGLYWQITWRFIAPVLIGVLVIASLVKETLNSPTYYVWNKDTGKPEERPYPSWCLTFGFFLALAGVIPIFLIGLLRAMKINILEMDVHSSQMRRIDTSASTRPMMSNIQEYHDDDDDLDNRSQASSDSDRGIVADEPISMSSAAKKATNPTTVRA